jgi:hypothetical protein
MSRIVRLLDVTELTPRQLAQKRYGASAKGRAALARYRDKKRQDAAWRAAESARVKAWDAAHRLTRRVYKRTWQKTAKRLKLAA